MKTLMSLSLVGFVLAVALALPLSEDKADALDNSVLNEIANDFTTERYDQN